MRVREVIVVAAAAASISACASLDVSKDQSIRVALAPGDASCLVLKDGVPVASITAAEATLTTKRSKQDLVFECQAPGYAPKTVRVGSSPPGWSGRFRCLVVDLCLGGSDDGARNSYPDTVKIVLDKAVRADKAQRR